MPPMNIAEIVLGCVAGLAVLVFVVVCVAHKCPLLRWPGRRTSRQGSDGSDVTMGSSWESQSLSSWGRSSGGSSRLEESGAGEVVGGGSLGSSVSRLRSSAGRRQGEGRNGAAEADSNVSGSVARSGLANSSNSGLTIGSGLPRTSISDGRVMRPDEFRAEPTSKMYAIMMSVQRQMEELERRGGQLFSHITVEPVRRGADDQVSTSAAAEIKRLMKRSNTPAQRTEHEFSKHSARGKLRGNDEADYDEDEGTGGGDMKTNSKHASVFSSSAPAGIVRADGRRSNEQQEYSDPGDPYGHQHDKSGGSKNTRKQIHHNHSIRGREKSKVSSVSPVVPRGRSNSLGIASAQGSNAHRFHQREQVSSPRGRVMFASQEDIRSPGSATLGLPSVHLVSESSRLDSGPRGSESRSSELRRKVLEQNFHIDGNGSPRGSSHGVIGNAGRSKGSKSRHVTEAKRLGVKLAGAGAGGGGGGKGKRRGGGGKGGKEEEEQEEEDEEEEEEEEDEEKENEGEDVGPRAYSTFLHPLSPTLNGSGLQDPQEAIGDYNEQKVLRENIEHMRKKIIRFYQQVDREIEAEEQRSRANSLSSSDLDIQGGSGVG